MTAEVLDEGVDDDVAVGISWLKDLLPAGQVAETRRAGDDLPFIWVEHMDGTECIEESYADDVIVVNYLAARGNGDATALRVAREGAAEVHQRMLLLARYLEDVPLAGGRIASIDYCDVFTRPRWEPYGDDQILRKVGRYRLGLGYAKQS